MKNLILLLLIASNIILVTACTEDEDLQDQDTIDTPAESDPEPLEVVRFENLHAPQMTDRTVNPPVSSGEFVRFDFETGAVTTDSAAWDIAFRGTTILVNGGAAVGIVDEPARTSTAAAYIVDATFEETTTVEESLFRVDGESGLAIPTGSNNGWYEYNPALMAITPLAGKVLVFRTSEGKYAKMEILSYYKDAPTTITSEIALADSRYYTFNYVYQPDESSLSL